jgi:uroporphyrinogen decarboxylase
MALGSQCEERIVKGRQRVERALAGKFADRLPVLPILHSGLAPLFDVPLGAFYTQAEMMADVIVRGYRTFGYDGVQLSLGVTGEAEALGARVAQPDDGLPQLQEHLLADPGGLPALRARDPTRGGRMPLFYDAVGQEVKEIGDEAYVLATMRGPLLALSQLRGVEQTMIDLITQPEIAAEGLDFTTEVALRLGTWLLDSGAHGLLLGEATCSPSFISPAMYRELVLPRHQRLVGALKQAGWRAVGMHICGDTTSIVEDIVGTGADFFDVDYQVPAEQAIAAAGGRIVGRGNLDPSAVFRFGTPGVVRSATEALCAAVGENPWIASSGCDIPPGTPAENIAAFVETIG